MKLKRCSHCKEEKSLGYFYRNRGRKDGMSEACKLCHKAYWDSEKGRAVTERFRSSEKGRRFHSPMRAMLRRAAIYGR